MKGGTVMNLRSIYTIEEAREYLDLYKKAEKEIVMGGAKSYVVGSREFTALDLSEIHKWIAYWADVIDGLTGNARTRKTSAVVFRDL